MHLVRILLRVLSAKRCRELRKISAENTECPICYGYPNPMICLKSNQVNIAYCAGCLGKFWKINQTFHDPYTMRNIAPIDLWAVSLLTDDPELIDLYREKQLVTQSIAVLPQFRWFQRWLEINHMTSLRRI